MPEAQLKVKKQKKVRQFRDKQYQGLSLSKTDWASQEKKIILERNWQITVDLSILNQAARTRLAKRKIELESKLKQIAKIVPDYNFGKAATDLVQELKDIRYNLRNPERETSIQVKHLKTGHVDTYEMPPGDKIFMVLEAFSRSKSNLRARRKVNKIDVNKIPAAVRGIAVDFVFGMQGMVHADKNQIFHLQCKKKTVEVYLEKKPMTEMRYLGVELEFCAPIVKEALGLELLNSGLSSYVHLKTDGSLRPQPGETAFEIAFLIPEKEFRLPLKKLCDVLTRVGAQTEGRRCGLHVHFDMRKRNKDLIYNNLVACQDVLWELIPPKRRNNEFCRNVRSRVFPKSFNGSREERYKSINAASYYRHKTLEVRMHEGTTSFDEIKNWLMLLIKIVNFRKKMKSNIKSVGGFKKKFKLKGSLLTYVEDRINFWSLNEQMDQPSSRESILARMEQVMASSAGQQVHRSEQESAYGISVSTGAAQPSSGPYTITYTNVAVDTETSGLVDEDFEDEE